MFEPISILLKIKPDPVEEMTKGGIILAQSTKDAEQKAAVTGTIVGIGDEVEHPALFIGARIMYARYAGYVFTDQDGIEYRFMKDEDVIAVEGEVIGNA